MTRPPSGTVTFLFTDIQGSTKLWQASPRDMKTAVARHDRLLKAAVSESRGWVFKTVGDAICAAFETAQDALAGAIAAQLALKDEPWRLPSPLLVRMALHTGEAEQRDEDYFGPSLNRVARLLAIGHGGQTLLSLVTAELVRDALPDGVSLRDMGEHRLKDLYRPEAVFQVLHPGLPSDFPALNSLDVHPHNLPVQPTPPISPAPCGISSTTARAGSTSSIPCSMPLSAVTGRHGRSRTTSSRGCPPSCSLATWSAPPRFPESSRSHPLLPSRHARRD